MRMMTMSYQEASQDVLSCPGHPMVFTDLVPSVLGARCIPDGAGTSQVAYLSPHVLHVVVVVDHRGPPPILT